MSSASMFTTSATTSGTWIPSRVHTGTVGTDRLTDTREAHKTQEIQNTYAQTGEEGATHSAAKHAHERLQRSRRRLTWAGGWAEEQTHMREVHACTHTRKHSHACTHNTAMPRAECLCCLCSFGRACCACACQFLAEIASTHCRYHGTRPNAPKRLCCLCVLGTDQRNQFREFRRRVGA